MENFNQCESKHWKLINKLNVSTSLHPNKTDIKLKNNQNMITNDKEEIVEIFGNHLKIFFTHYLNHLKSKNLDQINSPSNNQITKDEFIDSLKTLNTKASL